MSSWLQDPAGAIARNIWGRVEAEDSSSSSPNCVSLPEGSVLPHRIWGNVEREESSESTGDPFHGRKAPHSAVGRDTLSGLNVVVAPSGHRVWGSIEIEASASASIEEPTSSPPNSSTDLTPGKKGHRIESLLDHVQFEDESASSNSSTRAPEGQKKGNADLAGLDEEEDEDDEEEQGQPMFFVGTSALASIGSAEHSQGTCKPCRFMHTPAGCKSGELCTFCHLEHDKLGARPSLAKRKKYKKIVERLEQISQRNPDRLAMAVHKLPQHNEYLQDLLKKRLGEMPEATGNAPNASVAAISRHYGSSSSSQQHPGSAAASAAVGPQAARSVTAEAQVGSSSASADGLRRVRTALVSL